MIKKIITAGVIASSFLFIGCGYATQAEIAKMNFGPKPKNLKISDFEPVKDLYKDPDSVRIRLTNEEPVRMQTFDPRMDGWAVAIKVNAKNSYGGYVGYKRRLVPFKNGKAYPSDALIHFVDKNEARSMLDKAT